MLSGLSFSFWQRNGVSVCPCCFCCHHSPMDLVQRWWSATHERHPSAKDKLIFMSRNCHEYSAQKPFVDCAEIACNILQPQKVRLVYYCTSTKICLFLLHFFYAEWHWSNFHKLLVLWIDGGGTGDTLRFAGLWSSRQARSILSAPWTDRCFAEGEGMGSVRTHNTHLPPRDTLDEIWWCQYSVRQDKIIVLWTVVNYN
jgi:hypothetical protein